MIIMPPSWLTLEPLHRIRHSARARLDRPGAPLSRKIRDACNGPPERSLKRLSSH